MRRSCRAMRWKPSLRRSGPASWSCRGSASIRTSSRATQMRSRLRERFNVDFSFEDIFDCATVSALAARIETAASRRGAALPAWRPATAIDAPLSFQQQRMYLLSRLDPTRYNYNVVEVALLKGPIDVTALSAGLTAICARHEALRSVFV